MGKLRTPLSVKLFCGMLSPELPLFDACADILIREFGPLDLESAVMPWDGTTYYLKEMGEGIRRKFIFFERLIDPGDLSRIKRATNEIELRFARTEGAVQRRINLDPGYVTEAKVVLASTKDFSHRLYIGDGVFAEVTLRYSLKNRCFLSMDYTYPDYRSTEYARMFHDARDLLRASLRREHAARHAEGFRTSDGAGGSD